MAISKISTLWVVIFLTVLIWSGINPKGYFTWFLEVLPAMIGAIVLTFTFNTFRLTPLLYFFFSFSVLSL